MRLLLLLMCGQVAMAGTYGGVSREFAGYSASIDCSVGHWSDHGAEARAFADCKRRAEEELTRRSPEVAAAWKHFLAHGRPSLLALLDRTAQEGDWEHTVRVELSHPGDDVALNRNLVLGVYLKAPASEAQRLRITAEFARTQLAEGGLLARIATRKLRDLADTQQLLVGMAQLARQTPMVALMAAAERRDEIAELARALTPLPGKYQWSGDQRAALVTARILDAILKNRPLPDDTFGLPLEANAGAEAALLMATFGFAGAKKLAPDDALVGELLKL